MATKDESERRFGIVFAALSATVKSVMDAEIKLATEKVSAQDKALSDLQEQRGALLEKKDAAQKALSKALAPLRFSPEKIKYSFNRYKALLKSLIEKAEQAKQAQAAREKEARQTAATKEMFSQINGLKMIFCTFSGVYRFS